MSDPIRREVTQFGAHASPGSWFLSKESEIENYPALLPYSHYLRQAWRKLNLSGVLCVDQRPSAYLCGGLEFGFHEKREAHRFVWNQGLVPLLIFLTPNRIEVHSAVKKPEKAEGQLFDEGLSSLVESLDKVAKALEAAKLVRSIETGQFFRGENGRFFPANETVDRCLVENLIHTTRNLKGTGWELAQAHALLGRVLFVSFLHERGFIKAHYYPEETTCLLDILRHPTVEQIKHLLYREFFPRLKREFNGTMFDDALAKEEREVRGIHFDILRDFLSGADMESGQMTLDFWAYDFSTIPVETISAIYEEFMKDADLEKRRSEGAYYTPRHLAETTLHVALENRHKEVARWRVLDPACGSGIFLVGMFNMLAEQWQRKNPNSRKQAKAQALLTILQQQIRGIDLNPDACRITAFSLYLALFEKLRPIDVDEFKAKVRYEYFLPPLFFDGVSDEPLGIQVIRRGDFLKEQLSLEHDFDIVIGNPPWDSRGDQQIALHFAKRATAFLSDAGVACLLLPSTILVNRYGTLDGPWFRAITVEKIVQLADFRFILFEATHPCFIIRFTKAKPHFEHTIIYETPKLNRFDRRTGVFVIEPDDQKFVSQHDVLEAALEQRLQSLWSRKFWGTPRDETFLRRLDFYPKLADAIRARNWHRGVGFQPFYPGAFHGDPEPLEPWKLTDKFLPNDENFPTLVLREHHFSTLNAYLKNATHRTRHIKASTKYLRRKPGDLVFTPPMVIYSKGFTKFAFCNYKGKVRFLDGLRSISGPRGDANLLRFLTAVISSRLFKYIAFHSASNLAVGRDQIHLYESLALPFPLPDHELAISNASEIVAEAAEILAQAEQIEKRYEFEVHQQLEKWQGKLDRLVENYFSVSSAERILIEDTLDISQPSIHRMNLDADIPSLAFAADDVRKRYAETLSTVLNRRARKQGISINAQSMVSERLNLILLTLVFTDTPKPYREVNGEDSFWNALERVGKAAEGRNGPFSYLRGFSYVEPDRLHMLKPATLRNWCRTSALNDADAIFEHLTRPTA
jgi:hypothetical protein